MPYTTLNPYVDLQQGHTYLREYKKISKAHAKDNDPTSPNFIQSMDGPS